MSDVTANNFEQEATKILMSDVTASNRCSAQTNCAQVFNPDVGSSV